MKYCDPCAKIKQEEYRRKRRSSIGKLCGCGQPIKKHARKFCFDCAQENEHRRLNAKAKVYYRKNRDKILADHRERHRRNKDDN